MGVLDKLGQAFGVSKGMDIGEYMGSAEMEDVDVLHEPADMYVKPVVIGSEEDLSAIEEELSKKNIILLNIEEISKRPNTRNNIVASLKNYVLNLNPDVVIIRRIDQKYGITVCRVVAHAYANKEKMDIEPKHLSKRSKKAEGSGADAEAKKE